MYLNTDGGPLGGRRGRAGRGSFLLSEAEHARLLLLVSQLSLQAEQHVHGQKSADPRSMMALVLTSKKDVPFVGFKNPPDKQVMSGCVKIFQL